jgi:hypothetical protein
MQRRVSYEFGVAEGLPTVSTSNSNPLPHLQNQKKKNENENYVEVLFLSAT